MTCSALPPILVQEPDAAPELLTPMSSTSLLTRRALQIYLIGALGIIAELLLLGHYETAAQLVPLALLGLALAAGGTALRHAGSGRYLRPLVAVSWMQVAGGTLGFFFHMKSNVEFERQLHPNESLLQTYVDAASGAMPALAPGAIAFMGLLGIFICWLGREPGAS